MMFGYWPMGWMMWMWVIIIGALCYWGYNWYTQPRRYNIYSCKDPLLIAKERLAKGDITSEEYEKIREKLAEH
jgi:putative membrane protein